MYLTGAALRAGRCEVGKMNSEVTEEAVLNDDFETMLLKSLQGQTGLEGSVVSGQVVGIQNGMAMISVGLKSEGRIELKDLVDAGRDPSSVQIGETFEVFVERYEDKGGSVVLSREKARRQATWRVFEDKCRNREPVEGIITGRVKGGFTVDLSGISAFLPGSHVDVRMVKDMTPLMNIPLQFRILKMDQARNNMVVSRRAVIEMSQSEVRAQTLEKIEEGQVLEGVVRNMTDYGAFVDLNGIDGLLHVKDIAWGRVGHPADVLHVGQVVKVKIIRFIKETRRVSLGIKQLEKDPWEDLEGRYVLGQRVKGKIVLIVEYGAFVEIEPGVEGLVHVSEMSWNRQGVRPSEVVSLDQEIDVVILELNVAKRRVSLGVKQCIDNPFESFQAAHPVGTSMEVTVQDITEFGLLVSVTETIVGTAYKGDLSWEESGDLALRKYKRGDKIRARILNIDMQKERVLFGVKQLSVEGHAELGQLELGSVVDCEVSGVFSTGLEVLLLNGVLSGFMRKSELGHDRSEQNPSLFAVGTKLQAKIVSVDKIAWKVQLSIRALDEGYSMPSAADDREHRAQTSGFGRAFQEASDRYR